MPRTRSERPHSLVTSGTACLVVLAAALGGCATRVVTDKVYEKGPVVATLRHQSKGFAVVERDFRHPAAISKQRLSHILGAIDIETASAKGIRERRVAVHPELIEPIAKGLAEGLQEANSDQEVAVTAVRKQMRLGIFNKKFLTSLVAYVRGERLYLHFSRIEWEIPKDRKDRLPAPQIGEKQMAFRAVAARKMTLVGSQALAVRWRDPLFSAPVRSASGAGGPEQRRTILMDTPIPAEELRDDDVGATPGLDPETLRALADLEEARRAGSITEAEYQQRRETLLGGSGF